MSTGERPILILGEKTNSLPSHFSDNSELTAREGKKSVLRNKFHLESAAAKTTILLADKRTTCMEKRRSV
jgi:hypothetical protein